MKFSENSFPFKMQSLYELCVQMTIFAVNLFEFAAHFCGVSVVTFCIEYKLKKKVKKEEINVIIMFAL